MTDVAVIILTKDEKLHIARCVERLSPLEPAQIFVVDCFSTDGTPEIAGSAADGSGLRLAVVEHEWPGNQAAQFNWALENLPLSASWILRLDADEYLSDALVAELKSMLTPTARFNGVELPLARTWRGRLLRHEAGHVSIPRIFRRGCGVYDRREMDEKLVISGPIVRARNSFVDDNLKPFAWWQAKHRAYARKEARMEVLERTSAGGTKEELTPAQRNKSLYRKLPLFVRPFIYAFYRHFAWGVWRDGWIGLNWTLWQGLWYRMLVDREVLRLKRQRKDSDQNVAQ